KVMEVPRDVIKQSKIVAKELVKFDRMKVVDDDDIRFHPTATLKDIHSSTLKLVLVWCEKHKSDTPAMKKICKIPHEWKLPEWDQQFLDVHHCVVVALCKAAHEMQIKLLVDMTCKVIADQIKGKTTEELRAHFNIENDLTPEEEEAIRRDNERRGWEKRT
ncbi:hypothetical protein PFISCL1PPCAC_17665, partial [Pristionchus fissidentatus]